MKSSSHKVWIPKADIRVNAQAAMTSQDYLAIHPFTDSPIHRLTAVEVTEEHHIALARQVCRALAYEIGFSSVEVCYVETSVSELAGNLFFHTDQGGRIIFNVARNERGLGIEVISEDEGPGIEDVSQAMQDGFSTNGGLGCGLPGVERLMDEFEIASQPGRGTRIVARKWKKCR